MLPHPKGTFRSWIYYRLGRPAQPKHPLYQLSHKIDWSVFENAFKVHYSETTGKPTKPIRLMVSLLILKYICSLSDKNLIEQWSENIYYQYFSGEHYFKPAISCVPTELVALGVTQKSLNRPNKKE
jgi:IS5 family transposase